MKTTKLAILLSMIISVSLHAQELDQDFLDSLPDDLKEDLIQKNESKEKKANETYRPYLYSSKLSQAEELLSLKDNIAIRIRFLPECYIRKFYTKGRTKQR